MIVKNYDNNILTNSLRLLHYTRVIYNIVNWRLRMTSVVAVHYDHVRCIVL
jgi:hypothetical protein